MATPAHEEVQKLLRFLTQNAKIPLAVALPKIGALRKENLNTPEAITKVAPDRLQAIFEDEKASKQVSNAAKRAVNSRKRAASPTTTSPGKKIKSEQEDVNDPEAGLQLPTTEADVEELKEIDIETNRAAFFLAFTVVLLEFTMPEQPISSRLSLSQAVVSANSQSKAKYIGLSNSTAEDEGWAQGQPKVKIMNRQIAVMRREHTVPIVSSEHGGKYVEDKGVTIKTEGQEIGSVDVTPYRQAFWGLNLEALRKSNGRAAAGKLAGSSGPPIYNAESARSYLLRSLSIVEPRSGQVLKHMDKKRSSKEMADNHNRAAAVTTEAVRMLCASWADTLNREQLDSRAWSWYAHLRPEVAQGQAGWGQRGKVKLSDILALRRQL